MTKTLRAALPGLMAAGTLLAASLAHAQYAWIDDKGVRHYSDRPPPATVPAAKVLKAPGKRADDAPAGEGQPPQAAPKADAAPTLADREADYRKRAQERAKQEEKAAADAAKAKAKAQSCDNARRYKAMLDSGIRMVDTGADGERRYLNDDERARRAAEVNAILADCN
ncbi:DUF4124 domain-containing protein [Massilia agilis]|uniref:DUF4124 domain-containing protein n=1 Tax=Massilia agilis TaxID=1811226 RepID=A0ABT2D5D2_9BURK|nr:DUF4124 domain-containing protein [Massilia agilis]MCS0806517.1 DUF4124 domain-containing protein [Massilia agilis]